MNNFIKDIDDLFDEIKKTNTYTNYICCKNKLKQNKEINDLIEEIKSLQKKFVNTHDISIKKQIKKLNERLIDYPIYQEYLNYSEELNEELFVIKDQFEKYFNEILKLE